jgi:hypothetical protein
MSVCGIRRPRAGAGLHASQWEGDVARHAKHERGARLLTDLFRSVPNESQASLVLEDRHRRELALRGEP